MHGSNYNKHRKLWPVNSAERDRMRQLSFYGRVITNVFKMKVALIAGHQ